MKETGSIQSNTHEINYAVPVACGNEVENDNEAVAVVNNLPNDVASWPEVIDHQLKVELVKAGPQKYQNKKGSFAFNHRAIKVGDSIKPERRSASKQWFYKILKNDDRILRWLYNRKRNLHCITFDVSCTTLLAMLY